MNGDPCYGCEDRVIGCHSKCKRYNDWKEKMKQLKDTCDEVRKEESIIRSYVKESNIRNIKKKHIQ